MPNKSIKPDYPYTWAWRARPLTRIGQTDSGRKGEACRVIVRGGRNTALVEFERDGAQFYTSRNALRRRK